MRKTTCWMICGLLLATMAFGCARTQSQSPLQTEYKNDDITGNLDFWHGLADRPVVNNNELAHGMIEFANGQDPNTDYDARIAWLKSKGYLDSGFSAPANAAAERGTVAQLVCRAVNIKGGLTMRLLGAHPRYALRELAYLEIMPESTQQQGISGIEFVGVVNKAEAYSEDQR